MNLRLNRLAEMVDPDSRLADIGTDHAYLPILLVESGKISHAIASDVAAGPLENAKTDIASAGLSDQIETRLGSGLETIKESDQIDTVVIAGMGGKLMVNLLSEAASRGVYYPTLVLEANIGESTVRRWLMANKYEIVAEDIVYEGVALRWSVCIGQPYSSLPHRLRAEPPRRGGQGVNAPFSTV